jgi:hypothetical protein
MTKFTTKTIKMTTTFWAIFIREQQDLRYLAPRFNKFNLSDVW